MKTVVKNRGAGDYIKEPGKSEAVNKRPLFDSDTLLSEYHERRTARIDLALIAVALMIISTFQVLAVIS